MATVGIPSRAARAVDFRSVGRFAAKWWPAVIILPWLAVIVVPHLIASQNPLAINALNAFAPPSAKHWFGTDEAGRDIFACCIYGARISIAISLAVVICAATIGLVLGGLAGLGNKIVDNLVMRTTDVFLAFPYLILAIAISAAVGPGLLTVLIALIAVWWPSYARVTRGQILVLRELPFIDGAAGGGHPAAPDLPAAHVAASCLPALRQDRARRRVCDPRPDGSQLSGARRPAPDPRARQHHRGRTELHPPGLVVLDTAGVVHPGGCALCDYDRLATGTGRGGLTAMSVRADRPEFTEPASQLLGAPKPAMGSPTGGRATRLIECDVRGLTIAYRVDTSWLKAVRNVSFEIPMGEALALVGETGSGKSSIGYAAINMLSRGGKIVSGAVTIGGTDVLRLDDRMLRSFRGRVVGYVPQQPSVAFNPTRTIGKQVAESLIVHQGTRYKDTLELVQRTLGEMGLRDPERLIRLYPHQLSGGMLQRAMIASAIICDPEMLIADEPTSALDVTVQRQILDLLRGVQRRRNLTILLISHDLGAVSRIADKLMVLYAGCKVEMGEAKQLLTAPRHPYTRGLLASSPGRGQSHKSRLASLTGVPLAPADVDREVGCPFRTRCPRVVATCAERFPDPDGDDRHVWFCHNPEPVE